MSYQQFSDKLIQSNCAACELSNGRSQIVVDRGNPNSDVLIIGEAPGRDEDLQGKCFVGRSGKLLDKLFAELGFQTNDESLIINIVKCRPPDNRVPKSKEIEACSGWLKQQIEAVQPKWVLLLGATSLKTLFPRFKKLPVTPLVGKFFEDELFPKAQIMPVFHPAFILRNPNKKEDMLALLKTFLDARK